jgi:hypothetical protein
MTKEDTVMKVQWPRVLVATAFIVTLVALGALEVLTARLPVEQDPSAMVGRENEVGAASGQSPLLSLDYATGSDERARMEARGGQLLR